jgi:hypothetical protein
VPCVALDLPHWFTADDEEYDVVVVDGIVVGNDMAALLRAFWGTLP